MSKTSYAAMSLIAAIPAMFLCYLLTMAFLGHADKMPGLLSAVAGLTLLFSAVIAVTPVGIMLGGSKRAPKTSKKAAKAGAAAAAPAAPAAESPADDDVDESLSSDDDWTDSEELDEQMSDDWGADEAAEVDDEVSDEWDASDDDLFSDEVAIDEPALVDSSVDDLSDDALSDSSYMASEDFEAVETNEFVPSDESVETLNFDSDEIDAAISDDFEFDDNLSDEFDLDFDFDEDDEPK